MRYINIEEIELPDDWEAKVKHLEQQLDKADNDDTRKAIIEANSIWKQLFVPLSNLSNGKCCHLIFCN